MKIKRDILPELKEHLDKDEITLIVGARQAGKTTLMKELKREVDSRGAKSLLLSLDLSNDRVHFASQSDLLAKIRLELGTVQNGEKSYVFIDEIQRRQDAGVFLKGIYDLGVPYKFIVTGSGSLELKEKTKESLSGRKRIFEIPTCSFDEFANYKTGYRYEDRLQSYLDIEKAASAALLLEYMNFGGYPKVLLEERIKDKRATIDEIYTSYIDRDIAGFLHIDKIESYEMMIKLLASQIGGLVNHQEIANTLSIAAPTLKNYLWYAEKTFFVKKITPFFRNVKKELTKTPVYFFNDIGMRNFTSGLFGHISEMHEHGMLFQNFIFSIITNQLKGTSAKLHFWRTTDKAEVDFVVKHGSQLIPIEVKYQRFKSPDVAPSLRSFIDNYQPVNAYIVNLSYEGTRTIEGTKIDFIPWYKVGNTVQELLNAPPSTFSFGL